MELNGLQVFFGLVVAAAAGFAIAWLIRAEALAKAAAYIDSLEQLVAGTMRERELALERERARVGEARLTQQGHAQRVAELEKELEHREIQVIAIRDEAIQLARNREELGQQLAKHERLSQEVESKLAARIRELQGRVGDGTSGSHRPAGTRASEAREVAALVAAHESDLSQLEARFVEEIRQREVEIDALRQRLRMAEDELRPRDIEIDALRQRLRMAEAAAVANNGHSSIELDQARNRIAELEAQQSEPEPVEAAAVEPARGPAEPARGPAEPVPGPAEPAKAAKPEPQPSPKAASNGSARNSGKRRPRKNRTNEPDDLKLISGVDGSVEQALLLLGVSTFRQVARWKEKDVERMASKLYQPADRIRGEGWVESARQEHARKYGRDP